MRYLSSSEVCEYLRITPMTLKRWKDSGRIQYKQFFSVLTTED